MRHLSSTSADGNDVTSVPCLQHSSGVDIVNLINHNTGTPMLKALWNDASLRSSCTCCHPGEVSHGTPPTPATPNYSTPRRLSLSQPLSAYDQPGTITRPYSWASEYGGDLLPNEVDNDDDVLSSSSPAEPVNGGRLMHSSLALVHRHLDGAVCRTHAEQIMANH